MLEKSRFHRPELWANLRAPQSPPSAVEDESEDSNNLQMISDAAGWGQLLRPRIEGRQKQGEQRNGQSEGGREQCKVTDTWNSKDGKKKRSQQKGGMVMDTTICYHR